MPVKRVPDGTENIPPCCFVKNSVVVPEGDPIEGMQLTRVCEAVVGEGNIYGMQRLGDLWRIYCTTEEARSKLLTVGIEVREHHVDIMARNPFNFQGTGTSTKLVIGGVPLSVANAEIRLGLQDIGVEVKTSDIRYETYRDENNKWSNVKTGRRYVFIETPKANLGTHFTVGIWRASLWYRGQLRPSQKTGDSKENAQASKHDNVSQSRTPPSLLVSKNDMKWVGDQKITCLPRESSTADCAVRSNQDYDACDDMSDTSVGKSSFADTLKSSETSEDLNNFWFDFGSGKKPPFSGIRANCRGRSVSRSRSTRTRQSSVSPSPTRAAKPKLSVSSKRPMDGQGCLFPAYKRQTKNLATVDTSQVETEFQKLNIDTSESNVNFNHDSVR